MKLESHGYRWTSAEDAVLSARWKELGPEKLAAQLGRTLGSVQSRAKKLKLPSPMKITYTLEDVKRVTRCTTQEIARACHAAHVRPARSGARDDRPIFLFSKQQIKRILIQLNRKTGLTSVEWNVLHRPCER